MQVEPENRPLEETTPNLKSSTHTYFFGGACVAFLYPVKMGSLIGLVSASVTWECFQHRPSPNPFRGLALRASIKQLGILRNLLEFEPWLEQRWHTQEVTTGKQQSVWSLRVAPLEIQNHLQALDEFPIYGVKFGASLAIFHAKFEVSKPFFLLGFQAKFHHHLNNISTPTSGNTTGPLPESTCQPVHRCFPADEVPVV